MGASMLFDHGSPRAGSRSIHGTARRIGGLRRARRRMPRPIAGRALLTDAEDTTQLVVAPEEGVRAYITFVVGGRILAIPVSVVSEVIIVMRMLSMPDLPKGVVGVINVRGAVVPMLDMCVRLGLVSTEEERKVAVLVSLEVGLMGLLPDAVKAVVVVEDDLLLAPEHGAPTMVSAVFANRDGSQTEVVEPRVIWPALSSQTTIR